MVFFKMVRMNLRIFRIRHNLTQSEMAQRVGYERAAYSLIEAGTRNPSIEFFMNLQEAFNISDAEMWALTRLEKIAGVDPE